MPSFVPTSAQAAVLFGTLGYFAGRIGQWLSRHAGAGLWLDRIAGTVLVGLGLNKMWRRRTLEDTPSVRGMVHSIRHLVRIVDDKKKA